MATEPVNGAWKWIATICITMLIAGAPGIVYALRTWTVADQVDLIQQRQDDVRTRLTILETQNQALYEAVQDLERLLAAHIEREQQ